MNNFAEPEWEDWQDEILREGYPKGRKIEHMAKEIGRSHGAIWTRAKRLGLRHFNRAPKGPRLPTTPTGGSEPLGRPYRLEAAPWPDTRLFQDIANPDIDRNGSVIQPIRGRVLTISSLA